MKRLTYLEYVLFLMAVVFGTCSAASLNAQSMVGLGYLPGGGSFAYAIAVSADGSTVVGTDVSYSYEAFVWTAETGMVGLGTLPGSLVQQSTAWGVSADGLTVVGQSRNSDDTFEAFIWTASTGMVGLGGASSWANGVSADGSTVVGGSDRQAFIWTEGTGWVALGTLPGGSYSSAEAVSADGLTVVGYSQENQGNIQAFVWTAATGMIGLGTLPGDIGASASAVSADGSTVVGNSGNSFTNDPEAFVWTATGGMIGLGTLPGYAYSYATGVSADGSTICGYCYTSSYSEAQAYVWTASTGMVGLGTLPGAPRQFSVAEAVSADGTTVVGQSVNADGNQEPFVVRLDVAPMPADLINALIRQVVGLNLHHGTQNSLTAKLEAALHAIEQANDQSNAIAVNQLNAFINQVQAQRDKKIPTADADALIAAALRIIDLLNP